MRVALAAAAALSLLAPDILAQTEINALGPHVGDRAVAFRLPDQRGATQTLEKVAGPKGTMLVFFRSANW